MNSLKKDYLNMAKYKKLMKYYQKIMRQKKLNLMKKKFYYKIIFTVKFAKY